MRGSGTTVSTIFFWCNDVPQMRSFYSDLLGLKEIFSGEEAISYDLNGAQMFFLKSPDLLPEVKEWAAQPGYEVGAALVPSFIVEVPHDRFDEMVTNLKEGGVDSFHPEPTEFQRNRQFWVKDPMGNTVEIHDPGSG